MKGPPSSRFWIGLYSFVAVIMTIAVTVFLWLASQSRKQAGLGRTANARPAPTAYIPEERYELLSRFEPPVYHAENGVTGDAYAKGDFAGAVREFRDAARKHPDSASLRFHLGVSLLLAGDRAEGIQELKSAVAAGDTQYMERARFYLAKGLIGNRDVAGAREQLEAVAAQHGELEPQAKALLVQIVPGR